MAGFYGSTRRMIIAGLFWNPDLIELKKAPSDMGGGHSEMLHSRFVDKHRNLPGINTGGAAPGGGALA